MTIAAFGAHPDDIDIYMGGTLLLLHQAGHRIVPVVATCGELGNQMTGLPPDETWLLREAEQRQSMLMLDAIPLFLGYGDQLLADDSETRAKIRQIMQQIKPDLVFTHDTHDYCFDHRILARLVVDSISAGVAVFHADTPGGVGFEPQFYVNIDEVFNKKLEMMNRHISQMNASVLEMHEKQAFFRGLACRWDARYCEAFRLARLPYCMDAYKYLP